MFWESLQPFQKNNPSLAIQLIEKTVNEGAVYLRAESGFYSSKIYPNISLSANQQIALELCLANTPLMVIQGVYGSGKTRLAQVLAKGLIEQEKRIVILAHHSETLSAYQALPRITFPLSLSQDYHFWLKEQLQQQYLGKLSMDFLPNHLLSDPLLAKLRSPRKLEKYLSVLQDSDRVKEIKSLLKTEFPESSSSRLDLLCDRLKQLHPFLKQQLWLHQRSTRLDEEALDTLAIQIEKEANVSILGTVSEFIQPKHQHFWEQSFDCMIVEESEYLSWEELIFLAGITQKLILLGNLPLNSVFVSRTDFAQHIPLFWLGEFLLPTYKYQLCEQYRLHFAIAQPIFEVLYDRWIRTQPQSNLLTLPQLTARLQWQDVRAQPTQQENALEGKRIFKFISGLDYKQLEQLGILTFTKAQRDWLLKHCPPEFKEVSIAPLSDWIAKESKILLVSCVGETETLTKEDLAIALTRGSDYLILFGNYQVWRDRSSPLQPLLQRRELQTEREVSLI